MSNKYTVGQQVTALGALCIVKAADFPRLILQLDNSRKKRPQWSGAIRERIVDIGGDKYFVKSVSGARLYLVQVDILLNDDGKITNVEVSGSHKNETT